MTTSGWDVEDLLAFTWSRASSCPLATQPRLRPAAPDASLLVWGLVLVQAQLSEPHGAVEPPPVLPGWTTAASSATTFILLGAESLFQPPDAQQDTVSLNHGGNQALVQLVLPGGALLVLRQDASTLQGAEHLFLLGCSLCLGVHGDPGDGRRVGKMLTLSGAKPFPHQMCPRMCGCASSHCIRVQLSTSMIWALEDLGSFLL